MIRDICLLFQFEELSIYSTYISFTYKFYKYFMPAVTFLPIFSVVYSENQSINYFFMMQYNLSFFLLLMYLLIKAKRTFAHIFFRSFIVHNALKITMFINWDNFMIYLIIFFIFEVIVLYYLWFKVCTQ